MRVLETGMVEVLAGETDDAVCVGVFKLAYVALVLANALPFYCPRVRTTRGGGDRAGGERESEMRREMHKEMQRDGHVRVTPP